MVDLFRLGVNRIFYKSRGFNGGMLVSVELVFPNLIDRLGMYLDEFEEGIYFVDYDFKITGKYVGIFYENGVKRQVSSFSVIKSMWEDSQFESSPRIFLG